MDETDVLKSAEVLTLAQEQTDNALNASARNIRSASVNSDTVGKLRTPSLVACSDLLGIKLFNYNC